MLRIAVLVLATIPSVAHAAYIIKPGAEVTFTSEDTDFLKLDNTKGTGDLLYPIWVGPKVGGGVFNITLPPGGFLQKDSFKTKGGRWKLVAVVGDPIGIFEGPISTGSGQFVITTKDIPGLFESSTIDIHLVGGFGRIGATLPGNQLEGPDGGDTFIEYITSWYSFDPIGTTIDNNGVSQPLSLGYFDLVSVGRPSKFSYDFDIPTHSAVGVFTIQEDLVFRNLGITAVDVSTTIPGIVTKNFSVTVVPEPSSFSMLASIFLFSWLLTRVLIVRRSRT